MNVCAIILAAGQGTRMGRTKQLLPFAGDTVLGHVIGTCLSMPFAAIVAVVGHEAESVMRTVAVNDARFRWVRNEQYRSGMSSSLREAIVSVRDEFACCMVFLGDQPFITRRTAMHVHDAGMDELTRTGNEPYVIQPHYGERPAHPVFLGRFSRLDVGGLTGDEGARSLIRAMKRRIVLPLEDAAVAIDLDTPADYESALRMQQDREGERGKRP